MSNGTTPEPARGPHGPARSMREAQPYVDAVWQFIASVALMSWLGFWADGRFGTRPWLLVAGVFLGFASGTWAMVKAVVRSGRKP